MREQHEGESVDEPGKNSKYDFKNIYQVKYKFRKTWNANEKWMDEMSIGVLMGIQRLGSKAEDTKLKKIISTIDLLHAARRSAQSCINFNDMQAKNIN
jgi:hypothetical protein